MEKIDLLYQFLLSNVEGEPTEAVHVGHVLLEEIEDSGTFTSEELMEVISLLGPEVT